MSVEIKKISEVEAILPTHYCVEENGEVSYGDGQVDMGVEWIPVPDGFDFENEEIQIENGEVKIYNRDPKYVIGDLIGRPISDPRGVDYQKEPNQSIHRRLFFELGMLVRAEYYKEYSIENGYKDLVVLVTYECNINPETKELIDRTSTRRWVANYLEDGTPIFGKHKKVRKKIYSDRDRAKELRRRRGNLIDIMLDDSKILGVGEQVSSLFKDFGNDIDAYVASGDKSIMQTINDLSSPKYSWLDYRVPDKGYTIKDSIIYQINEV